MVVVVLALVEAEMMGTEVVTAAVVAFLVSFTDITVKFAIVVVV